MIVRESEPQNLEMPFEALAGFLTPTDEFYVRNHFAVPELAATDWSLRVEGAVDAPLAIGMAELRALPAVTITATLECAGNGRISLVPKAKGLLWDQGAVGTARWTGVPLRALLGWAGVRHRAVDVILEGADHGVVEDEPKTPGVIAYARSVPLAKALDDVILAYQMNGADLTPAHGWPLRAIVPGWYGMASVKWLQRVVVADRPFAGYFQTLDYAIFDRINDVPSLVPLTENAVKAQIARPTRGEVVASDQEYRVHGAAWAGPATVTLVEISADDGQTWIPAHLLGEPIRHAWRLWEYPWRTPATPGRYRLLARASDDQGRIQPQARDSDLRTVMIHHVVPVAVEVR